MSEPLNISDAFLALLNDACDGTITPMQAEELASLLLADSGARGVYIDHLQLRRHVQSLYRAERVCDAGLAMVQTALPDASRSGLTAPILVSAAPQGIFSYLSSGWPVAYLIATVIFAIGLSVGARTYVAQPGRIAIKTPASAVPVASPAVESVGRVTGMADCKWINAESAPAQDARVLLGSKYALVSGVMEITYDTGAKVVLQGPVNYAVESKNGGFMQVGKLTGKMENETAKGFVVRTPTAVVTDLGTEFGVEVYENGTSEVHILVGAVDLMTQRDRRHMRLDAPSTHGNNASAARVEVDRSQNSDVKMVLVSPDPHRFLRAMPKPSTPKREPRILISSQFNLSTEGWMASPAAVIPGVVYSRGAGIHGGCIQAQEGSPQGAPTKDYFYFIAPPAYCGDRSAAFGGELKFDVYTTIYKSLPNVPESMATEPPLVVLEGRIGRIAANQPSPVKRDQWTSLSVPLSSAGKWYRLTANDALEGKQTDCTPVSDDVIREVLRELRDVWIRGEYMHGLDLGRIDNVFLVAPVGTVEYKPAIPSPKR